VLWDVFCGYNFQFGKVIVGAEALAGMEYARPKVFTKGSAATDTTTPAESTSLKRKYSFGLVPHVGYNIVGGLNVYVNFGTVISKYNLRFKKRTKSSTAATAAQAAAQAQAAAPAAGAQAAAPVANVQTPDDTDEPETKEKKAKKNKTKASMLFGFVLEQNFGPFFVRAECNKIFGKKIAEVEEGNEKVKTDSCVFKVGGGYRF
jgi:hypothetical protein